jgi:copper-containing nitrite reductase
MVVDMSSESEGFMRTKYFDGLHIRMFLSFLLSLLLVGASTGIAQTAKHSDHVNAGTKAADIVRDPTDLPPPVGKRDPSVVHVTLTAEEIIGTLDSSAPTTYRYWTFNGKVPGPMIRVRQGDTVQVTLHNDASSHMTHSIDFHAALGPGGGAALTQTAPGQSKTFTFEATTPGLFVYHCGTPMIAEHMANGMYGLILVEPDGGLPPVDHEYYVMQGEIYSGAPIGKQGLQQFSAAKLMAETPEYFVLNGAVGALVTEYPMPAKVGETVRVFFGNAGPNETASMHVVGEIFTRLYELGSLTSSPLSGIQTAGVPPGAAAILEFAAKQPGKFDLMDHAMARMAKGDMAVFDVTGPENAGLMHAGPASSESGSTSAWIDGITRADEAANQNPSVASNAGPTAQSSSAADDMGGTMHMQQHAAKTTQRKVQDARVKSANAKAGTMLNGCLVLAADGKALLRSFPSSKMYRLEARPLLFSENANRFVHITGQFGSVMPVEDPHLPSFVVDTVEAIAPTCGGKITTAQIQRVLAKHVQASRGVVGMSEMGFLPRTMEINAGETVVWRNSSEVTHNVVADPGRAVYAIDVKLPSGVSPFGSGFLQPGQSFSHTFTVPGIYRYVCTLHETSGMKGVVIVKGPQVLEANKQGEESNR